MQWVFCSWKAGTGVARKELEARVGWASEDCIYQKFGKPVSIRTLPTRVFNIEARVSGVKCYCCSR